MNATGESCYNWYPEKSTQTVMAALREVIKAARSYSAPCIATGAAIFRLTRRSLSQKVDQARVTQAVGRYRELSADDSGLLTPGTGTQQESVISGLGRDGCRKSCALRHRDGGGGERFSCKKSTSLRSTCRFRVQATQAGSAFTVCRQRDLEGVLFRTV